MNNRPSEVVINKEARTLEEGRIYTEKEVAALLYGDRCTPTTWKTVQKMARNGEINGRQTGRGWWLFHSDAIKDYLMMRPGK